MADAKVYAPDRIRNVVLVGHGGSGKTTLVEGMLFRSGAINRLGRVEDGTTVTDHDPEEKARGVSLNMGVAYVEWRDHKINVIDTPGFPDFIGEVVAALRVADLALFVVSAVEGVEVQTELIWRMAAERGIPRFVFVNKLDRERADYDAALESLRDKFGAGVAPLMIPIGAEADFKGVADLLSGKAWTYEGGKPKETTPPADVQDAIDAQRDGLIEGIVSADDDLLEKYLEGEDIPADALARTLAKGLAEGAVFPVVPGAAGGAAAIDHLLDLLVDIGPSPLARPGETVRAGDAEVVVAPDPAGEPLAFVFKNIADPYVGNVSLFKVLSGSVKVDDHLHNSRSGADERLHGIALMRGAEQAAVAEVKVGDIAAVAKLAHTLSGDTLAPKGKPVAVSPIEYPAPVLSTAIVADAQADEDKLGNALSRLIHEDPTLHTERNDETHQTLLSGLGETHLRIAIDKLARKFGVHVHTEDVKIAYRETILGSAEAEGKHKKQSGGRGQFGVCYLRVAPLPRGEGFQFHDEIVGGAIPRQFIPAVEKGVSETMEQGGALGFPVVDVSVACFDGKYHSVDSDEMSFKIAGRVGFRDACAKAQPVLLEPISRLEVTVPLDHQGDVMGDLNARRGRVQGTEAAGNGEQTIVALVPTSEILRYAIDLRSISGGRGRFRAAHDHYDVVPQHLSDKIVSELAAAKA
ncbi:MAG: elongation factor G [Acidimicrobiales bacterium]